MAPKKKEKPVSNVSVEDIADEVKLLKQLLGLRGANLAEVDSALRTIAMKGPRGTIHSRYPDHDIVLAWSLLWAGNAPYDGDDETSFDSPHVATWLVQYSIQLISLEGKSRDEWVKIAEAMSNASDDVQERIKEQMGGVLHRR